MNKAGRTLHFDVFFFLVSSVLIWTINFICQDFFPGNNLFPFAVRSGMSFVLLAIAYLVNDKFCRRNLLNNDILKFRFQLIKYYIGSCLLIFLIVGSIWVIIYFIYPFYISINAHVKVNLVSDLLSYSLGNTLEEFLFRGFLLLALVKLLGNIVGSVVVSLLFGLFHLQGIGLTSEGVNMFMTTFTMSLLFIALIYYTKSIWTAVILHISGNIILHSLGFDGAKNGIFQIEFASNTNGNIIFLIFEIVVITFALFIYFKQRRRKLVLTTK